MTPPVEITVSGDGQGLGPGQALQQLLPRLRAGEGALFLPQSDADAPAARILNNLAEALKPARPERRSAEILAFPGPRRAQRPSLLVITNQDEARSPSSAQALALFAAVCDARGLETRAWALADGTAPQADAAFIRAFTQIDGAAHAVARQFEAAGRPVIDSPEAIRRGCNKIFQALTFRRHGVPAPRTEIVLGMIDLAAAARAIGSWPLVVKTPGEAFCEGVHLVRNLTELRAVGEALLGLHGGLVVQAFLPTASDWRIGVLDGRPLYAARYAMAAGSWRLCERADGEETWGDVTPASLGEVPPHVLDAAVAAGAAMGRSLWGVDVKDLGGRAAVIEVNDNPDLDEVETASAEDRVWERLADWFAAAIARAGAGVAVRRA